MRGILPLVCAETPAHRRRVARPRGRRNRILVEYSRSHLLLLTPWNFTRRDGELV